MVSTGTKGRWPAAAPPPPILPLQRALRTGPNPFLILFQNNPTWTLGSWLKPSTPPSPSPGTKDAYDERSNVSTADDGATALGAVDRPAHAADAGLDWTPWNEPLPITTHNLLLQKDNVIRELRTLLDECHTQIRLMRLELLRTPRRDEDHDALRCHRCQRHYPRHQTADFLHL